MSHGTDNQCAVSVLKAAKASTAGFGWLMA